MLFSGRVALRRYILRNATSTSPFEARLFSAHGLIGAGAAGRSRIEVARLLMKMPALSLAPQPVAGPCSFLAIVPSRFRRSRRPRGRRWRIYRRGGCGPRLNLRGAGIVSPFDNIAFRQRTDWRTRTSATFSHRFLLLVAGMGTLYRYCLPSVQDTSEESEKFPDRRSRTQQRHVGPIRAAFRFRKKIRRIRRR